MDMEEWPECQSGWYCIKIYVFPVLAQAWFDRRFKNHWPRMQNWSEC